MNFTKDQENAINTLDKSILVAAAAGSGKTAVLVERIIKIIIDGKADVDEMLVVTFTNAAATEMRLKLTTAIKKRIKEEPERASELTAQLDKMYRAYISTFHGFAGRIIREFFHKTDLEPNFKISDETQATLLQMEAMDELFEEGFADDAFIEGGSFREFLIRYSSDRREDSLKDEMIKTYNKLRSIPNYMEWARGKAEILGTSKEDFEGSDLQSWMTISMIRKLEKVLKHVDLVKEQLEEAGLTRMAGLIDGDKNIIANAIDSIRANGVTEDTYDEISRGKWVVLRTKDEEKETYGEIKDVIDKIRKSYKLSYKAAYESYLLPSLSTMIEEMNETYSFALYYISLLERFEKIFEAKKMAINVIDFGDMEHTCVKILEDPDVAEIIRKRFKYIFIDEYQDTNKLQEYLINRFARPDNVFKVGDVKQSIYGFRQSDPKIFMSVREEYGRQDNEDAIVIDLNKNFRSNSRTIDYINHVFEGIMPHYDANAKLYNGMLTPDSHDYIPEVHILFEEQSSSESAEDTPGESDEQATERYSKREVEANYVAGLVESIIGTEFYDSKINEYRTARARDIAILMRGVKSSADIYYKAMLERDIKVHVTDDAGYFDTVEIEVATALLRVIDNMKQDVPLVAVLRSEIFGFGPEELAKIRISYRQDGGRGVFYRAFNHMADKGDTPLAKKASEARDRMLEWKRQAGLMAISEFVWHVLVDSGYYLYAGAMYGGRQRQANLRVLAEKAGTYQETGIASLGGFVRYIDILKRNDVNTGQATMVGEEDDVVRIMTIHKSKGLEFPFVIVSGIGNKLIYSKNESGFSLDSDLGVAISYINTEDKFWRPTLMQHLMHDSLNEAEYQEELRVLYVAMTRARQKLYLVGTAGKREDVENGIQGENKYLEIIKNYLETPYNKYVFGDVSPITTSRQANALKTFLAKRTSYTTSDDPALYEEVGRMLDYEYPDKKALETKAKYSVSELRALKEERGIKHKMELREFALSGDEDLGHKERLREATAETQAPLQGTDNAQSSSQVQASAQASLQGPGTAQTSSHVQASAQASLQGPGTTQVRVTGAEAEVAQVHMSSQVQSSAPLRVTGAEIGTGYHRIMETIDFARVIGENGINREYIGRVAAGLNASGAIEDRVYAKLELRKIERFFESELGRRAAAAAVRGTLHKEKPFTMKYEHDGMDVLVQGIIDCCFVEDGKYILVDYKSNYVGEGDQAGRDESDQLARENEHVDDGSIDQSARQSGQAGGGVGDGRRDADLENIVQKYREQIVLYKQAIELGTGTEVAESYLYLFSLGTPLKVEM